MPNRPDRRSSTRLKFALSLALILALACAVAEAQTKTVPKRTPAETGAAAAKSPKPAEAEQPRISREVYEAEEAIDKNDFPRAEKLLKQALGQDASDFRAWLDLGIVFKATGNDSEAVNAFRKAVEINPKSFEANLNAGLSLGDIDPAAATQYLRTATALAPADKSSLATAWSALAGVLVRTDRAAAIAAYQEWITLQPESVTAHASLARAAEQSDPALAERHYKRALELNPKLEHVLAGLTNLYLSSKRYQEAEGLLRQIVAMQPTNTKARLNLARVLEVQGKSEEASAEYSAVQKADPTNVEALSAAAGAAFDARDYPSAESLYAQIMSRDPRDARAAHAYGRTLLAQKKYQQAAIALQQALKLDPHNTDAYGDLAFAASALENYPLAIQVLDARAKLTPETPETLFLRATAYDHLRSPKQATEFYRKFLEVAGGKYPDQEWQARHRLNAIDPDKKK